MHDAFAFHKLNQDGQAAAKGIAAAFDELLQKIGPSQFDARTSAIARTKLEEACFFAKKSMAMDPLNQDTR